MCVFVCMIQVTELDFYPAETEANARYLGCEPVPLSPQKVIHTVSPFVPSSKQTNSK